MEYIKQNTRRANDETLNRYIDSVDEMNKMEKALEFPLIFMKHFLISILDSLQKIKSNYMRKILQMACIKGTGCKL